MSPYTDQFTSLISQLERVGKDAAIPESRKASILLASIDPDCSLVLNATALPTKDVSELTWYAVATLLIDEYNAHSVTSNQNESKSL